MISNDYAEARQEILRRASNLVERLAEMRRSYQPPFLARELAPLLGIQKIQVADLGDLDALLFPLGTGYQVRLNAKYHPLRQNFSLAHEIGHIILKELGSGNCGQRVEFRGADLSDDSDYREQERLCNIAAAQLLMPQPVFKKSLDAYGRSINSIELLARKFWTSIRATLRRVAEVSEEPCVAIEWRLAQQRRWLKLVAVWSAQGDTEEPSVYPLPYRFTVGRQSGPFKAYEVNGPIVGYDRLTLRNEPGRYYAESKAFGIAPKRYVATLVFPERKAQGRRQP